MNGALSATSPGAMELYDLRAWDLHYQHRIIAGGRLSDEEREHWQAVTAAFCRKLGGG